MAASRRVYPDVIINYITVGENFQSPYGFNLLHFWNRAPGHGIISKKSPSVSSVTFGNIEHKSIREYNQ